jgi:hypothetical protein
LVAERMDRADYLLATMKRRIDSMVATDAKIQELLIWVEQKSSSVNVPYKSAAIRAFYFARDLDFDRDLDRDLDFDFDLGFTLASDFDLGFTFARDLIRDLIRDLVIIRDRTLDLDRTFDLNLDLAHALDRTFDRALDLNLALDLDLVRALDLALDLDLVRALDFALDLDQDPELKRSLQSLKDQLPNRDNQEQFKEYQEQFEEWWKINGTAWTEELRSVMIEHRNIGHDWQFSPEEKELLQQYYDANTLLVDCLNSECYVTKEVRRAIEEELLLPVQRVGLEDG